MNRWPRVTLAASMPSTENGTTSASNRHRMDCSGRTQRKLPEPQRMDLGHGNLRMTSGTSVAITSVVSRPGLSMRAT